MYCTRFTGYVKERACKLAEFSVLSEKYKIYFIYELCECDQTNRNIPKYMIEVIKTAYEEGEPWELSDTEQPISIEF
jgi:hypothetical protein